MINGVPIPPVDEAWEAARKAKREADRKAGKKRLPPQPCCGCWCHRKVSPNETCSMDTCGHESCRLPWETPLPRHVPGRNMFELMISADDFVDPRPGARAERRRL